MENFEPYLEEVLRLLLEKVAEEEGIVVDGETVAFAGEFVPHDADAVGGFAVWPDGGRGDVVLEGGQRDSGGKCCAAAFCRDAVDGDGHADGGGARDVDLQAVVGLYACSGVEDGAVEWFENLQHDGSRGRKWLKNRSRFSAKTKVWFTLYK